MPPASMAWFQTVQAAFPHPALCHRIAARATTDPDNLPALFEDIARYVLSLKGEPPLDAPANAKKRKLDDSTAIQQSNGHPASTSSSHLLPDPSPTFDCPDVSFQVPARKKLRLQLVAAHRQPTAAAQEIRLLHPSSESPEYLLPSSQIDSIFCLPVPEKQQRQWNFVVIPRPGAVSTADGAPYEQIVFTLNESAPANLLVRTSATADDDTAETYVTVTEHALRQLLKPYGKDVVRPSEDEFASSIPQSHRKGEKAFHVKAHRGSKEGYLFFLPTGILFGFKKPLVFFPFHAIVSISYTSVLQRTFNLEVTSTPTAVSDAGDGDAAAVAAAATVTEFAMLDQADFAGIDEYIRRHGLHDASMAAERRAKAYNVNKDAKQGSQAGGGGPDGAVEGQSELAKAEQQLQDEEDEEEEDYEASGGESDGEGEGSSEDEDGDGEGGDYDDDDDADDDDADDDDADADMGEDGENEEE